MSASKKPQPQKVNIESKKTAEETPQSKTQNFTAEVGPLMFDKKNYTLMIVGVLSILVGFALMSGGASEDPNVFNAEEVYSFRRITLAPILVILGFVIEIYAIFKGKNDTNQA